MTCGWKEEEEFYVNLIILVICVSVFLFVTVINPKQLFSTVVV
jgi:hypothetical protein